MPSIPPSSPISRQATSLWSLTFILIVAAALRLYRLDLPSMWWDEILVPLTSRFSVDYIVNRSFSQDFHPPLFYLIIKAVLTKSASDFSLRLIPALAGIAGVYLMYRAGRTLFSPTVGLFAAAMLALSPLHLLLSRQVRPYTLVFDLSLLSLWALLVLFRNVSSPYVRPLLGLVVANLGLAMLHFTALLVIGAEGLLLLGLTLVRYDRRSLWILVWYSVGSALAVGVVLPFLLGSWGANTASAETKNFAALAALAIDRLGETLWFLPHAWARLLVVALAGFGLVRLWTKDLPASLVLMGFTLLPLATVVAAGYSTYFNPWHLAVLLPAVLLAAGVGLAFLLPSPRFQPVVAMLLCLLAIGFYPTAFHKRFYAMASHSGEYKPLAQTLAGLAVPGSMVFFSDPGLANAVNWYAGHFASPDPLIRQRLSPSSNPVDVLFVATGGFGHLAQTESELYAVMGQPKNVINVYGARIYRFQFSRTPVIPLGALPSRIHLTMLPTDLYTRAFSLENVTYLPFWGGGLVATANNLPGHLEYAFANDNTLPQELTVFFGFNISGESNLLTLEYAFDDEPWQEGFRLEGPIREGDTAFRLTRRQPYQLFRLRFSLLCAERTPVYPGGNLESLRLKDFKVHVDPAS